MRSRSMSSRRAPTYSCSAAAGTWTRSALVAYWDNACTRRRRLWRGPGTTGCERGRHRIRRAGWARRPRIVAPEITLPKLGSTLQSCSPVPAGTTKTPRVGKRTIHYRKSGGTGIRTQGACAQRFSRPSHSAALAPLRDRGYRRSVGAATEVNPVYGRNTSGTSKLPSAC